MKTYRDVVYAVMDSLKLTSDDSSFEIEHMIYLINKYRALTLRQRFLSKKMEVPRQYYQRLKIFFDKNDIIDGAYKSIKQLPDLTSSGMIGTYNFISSNGAYFSKFNYVNQERFRYVGADKWSKLSTFFTIDYDGYMLVKNKPAQFPDAVIIATKNLSDNTKTLIADELLDGETEISNALALEKIEGFEVLFDALLDNPLDEIAFNGLQIYNPLDMTFPADENGIQLIISMACDEVYKIMSIGGDKQNNANDDNSVQPQKKQQQPQQTQQVDEQ